MPLNFTVWVDASSHVSRDEVYTAIGHVIKDRDLPPIITSLVIPNIYNSKGEIKAGIEAFKNLKGYCRSMSVNPQKCTVDLKTDFSYLKTLLETTENNYTDPAKHYMIDNLRTSASAFGKVKCDLISGRSNLAHGPCNSKMKNQDFKIDEEFMRIFNNPQECVLKVNCRY